MGGGGLLWHVNFVKKFPHKFQAAVQNKPLLKLADLFVVIASAKHHSVSVRGGIRCGPGPGLTVTFLTWLVLAQGWGGLGLFRGPFQPI